MKIIHVTRRNFALTGILLVLAVVSSLLLGGCFQREDNVAAPLHAATDADRAAFLTAYGWEIDTKAIETLDLVLPLDLAKEWAEYTAIQDAQGLPFAQYGGQAVRRYTYAVTNYPGSPQGVQVNLYQCGEDIIGGDVMILGENGGQYGLERPKE